MAKNTSNAVVAKYWDINELHVSTLEHSKCERKNSKWRAASEGWASLSSDGLAANGVL